LVKMAASSRMGINAKWLFAHIIADDKGIKWQ